MSKEDCKKCRSKCCKYVSTEIDAPENLEDIENIRWFVAHKNVQVSVDCEGVWHLEFLTPCEFLDKDTKCTIYEKRPSICREYSTQNCTFHNDYEDDMLFETIGQVDKYIEKEFKKNNWALSGVNKI